MTKRPSDDDPLKAEITEENDLDVHRDSSEQLSSGLGWDKPEEGKTAPPSARAEDGAGRRPSPFGPAPGENLPPQAKEAEPPKPAALEGPNSKENPSKSTVADGGKEPDSAARKDVPRFPEPPFAKELPPGVKDSTQRAFNVLKEVQNGKALTPEQKARFESALQDASKLDPKWASEQEKNLTAEVQNKERRLPSGMILPPWTAALENKFVGHLQDTNKAFSAMPEDLRQKVSRLNASIEQLAPDDSIRRGVFQKMLADEAVKEPSLRDYLLERSRLDSFSKENASGLLRRHMHQQELSLLHAKALCSGFYALGLDAAGQPTDKKQIEKLAQDALNDRFSMSNFPDFAMLAEKYKLEEKQAQEIDSKVPGRTELRKALEIMNDPAQGTSPERLEKARPFFEKAIGASEQIDMKATLESIEKLSKERNELGENCPPDKLDELEKTAVELVEKARLPYSARLAYAMALNNTAVETKNTELVGKALALLKAAERIDPANAFDPIIQGALLLAQKETPELITEEKAMAIGKPEVEKRKEELVKAGKQPDDQPAWQKALNFAGQTFIGIAAFHLIGKYVFSPIGSVKNHIRRSWEMSSRVKNVSAESSPSLAPGEEARLMYRDRDGRELPVEGVRKSDGKIRVWNGESTELVKLGRKDSLYFKVAPDKALSAEEMRALAAKKLQPVEDDRIINEQRERFKSELAQKDLELEQLKLAQEELKRQIESKKSGAEAPARELYDKLPERLRKAAPEGFNQDLKDALAEVLESNRGKWSADYVQGFESLLADYEKGEASAFERVNKMIADGKSLAGSAAANTPAALESPGVNRGNGAGEAAQQRFQTPELNRDQAKTEQRAFETITSIDGIKYIESIPIGELSVARVEEKMKDIDREIKRVRDAGLHDYAEQLEKIKRDYESKSSPVEKEAYCKEVMARMREAHETCKSAGSRGLSIAGKAGTAVAVLMVAGWLLDVAAPPTIAKPSGSRVVPGKRN